MNKGNWFILLILIILFWPLAIVYYLTHTWQADTIYIEMHETEEQTENV